MLCSLFSLVEAGVKSVIRKDNLSICSWNMCFEKSLKGSLLSCSLSMNPKSIYVFIATCETTWPFALISGLFPNRKWGKEVEGLVLIRSTLFSMYCIQNCSTINCTCSFSCMFISLSAAWRGLCCYVWISDGWFCIQVYSGICSHTTGVAEGMAMSVSWSLGRSQTLVLNRHLRV